MLDPPDEAGVRYELSEPRPTLTPITDASAQIQRRLGSLLAQSLQPHRALTTTAKAAVVRPWPVWTLWEQQKRCVKPGRDKWR